MSAVTQTAEEVFDSLNGFDEIAIAKFFGDLPEDLGGFTLGRSLIFVLKRREGLVDLDAHAAAMTLTIGEVIDYFAPAEDAEAGKDETSPEPEPDN